MYRYVIWALTALFLILVGAFPTVGLALHGAEVLLALIPGIVWLAGGALVLTRRQA